MVAGTITENIEESFPYELCGYQSSLFVNGLIREANKPVYMLMQSGLHTSPKIKRRGGSPGELLWMDAFQSKERTVIGQ